MYRTTFCGNLCLAGLSGLWEPAEDFLRSIGRFEEYDLDVSREETGDGSSEDSSESYSESSDCSYFSTSCFRLLACRGRRGLVGLDRFVTFNGSRVLKPAILMAVRGMLLERGVLLWLETLLDRNVEDGSVTLFATMC